MMMLRVCSFSQLSTVECCPYLSARRGIDLDIHNLVQTRLRNAMSNSVGKSWAVPFSCIAVEVLLQKFIFQIQILDQRQWFINSSLLHWRCLRGKSTTVDLLSAGPEVSIGMSFTKHVGNLLMSAEPISDLQIQLFLPLSLSFSAYKSAVRFF